MTLGLLAPLLAVPVKRLPDDREWLDVSDPECPVFKKPCRACGVMLEFPMPGGARPLLMAIARRGICSECGELEEAEEAVRASAGDRDRRVRESGMQPALYEAAVWEEIVTLSDSPGHTTQREAAVEVAKTWASKQRPEHNLVLFGPTGSGKTRLAATAARERLERWPLTWVSVAVLMAQLQGAWNDDERKRALKVLTSTSVVVLDDFDKVADSPQARALIFAALDGRDQARTSMLITTNLSPSHLAERFGEAITSRLVGGAACMGYPGVDRRLTLEATS